MRLHLSQIRPHGKNVKWKCFQDHDVFSMEKNIGIKALSTNVTILQYLVLYSETAPLLTHFE